MAATPGTPLGDGVITDHRCRSEDRPGHPGTHEGPNGMAGLLSPGMNLAALPSVESPGAEKRWVEP